MTELSLFAKVLQDQCRGAWTPDIAERTDGQYKHLKDNHKLQTDRAVARYRAVMRRGQWYSTGQIQQNLGYGQTICNAFLRKLKKLGFVERRPRFNNPTFQRQFGWEWKWTRK